MLKTSLTKHILIESPQCLYNTYPEYHVTERKTVHYTNLSSCILLLSLNYKKNRSQRNSFPLYILSMNQHIVMYLTIKNSILLKLRKKCCFVLPINHPCNNPVDIFVSLRFCHQVVPTLSFQKTLIFRFCTRFCQQVIFRTLNGHPSIIISVCHTKWNIEPRNAIFANRFKC